ncbi:MAG: sensor histidine kinase KdpD [Deltaproteobacteria bacterium]|nr:sensor histidine kinase KdpD [Deltaproteobacteria bacterium]
MPGPASGAPPRPQEEPKRAGSENLLVCLDPSPFSIPLIRATQRIADAQQAKWFAMYVETPSHDRLPRENQEQVAQALYLAAKLGAQAIKVSGFRIGDEILAFARENQVSKIFVGKPYARRWRRFLGLSLVDHLIWNCGPIDIFVISGEGEEALPVPPGPKPRLRLKEYLVAAGGVGVCTGLAFILFPYLALTNLAMIYLLTVVIISSFLARGPALFSSLFSVAAFAFFFVPAYYSFAVANTEYSITLLVMLLVSLLVSGLTARIRHQARVARTQERQTAALFGMSQNLTAMNSLEELLQIAVEQITRIFDCRVTMLMPGREDKLGIRAGQPFVDDDVREGMVAKWVFKHGHLAGAGTGTLSAVKGIYLPLIASQHVIGVLRLETHQPERILAADSLRLLEALGSQVGLAIERENLSRQAQAARLQIDAEQMRNTLLSSVSHDLRTPLTVIAGSASSLLEGEKNLDADTKHELAQSIYEEARRLDRLVYNLLEMSRLQSGEVKLNKEWNVLEEVIGSALTQLDPQLHDHPVSIALPADLPLVQVDALLMERVIINLLENSMKYTPSGTPLKISGRVQDKEIFMTVADRGPGLPVGQEERIFEKFYQVAPGSARGAGLGLTICRSIIEAHGGRIRAANRPEGGAVFSFTIPLAEGAPILDKHLPEMQKNHRDEADHPAD